MDLVVYFLIAMAVQYGGYRLWGHLSSKLLEEQRLEDIRNTRSRGGLGIGFIGGVDRPGEN